MKYPDCSLIPLVWSAVLPDCTSLPCWFVILAAGLAGNPTCGSCAPPWDLVCFPGCYLPGCFRRLCSSAWKPLQCVLLPAFFVLFLYGYVLLLIVAMNALGLGALQTTLCTGAEHGGYLFSGEYSRPVVGPYPKLIYSRHVAVYKDRKLGLAHRGYS